MVDCGVFQSEGFGMFVLIFVDATVIVDDIFVTLYLHDLVCWDIVIQFPG